MKNLFLLLLFVFASTLALADQVTVIKPTAKVYSEPNSKSSVLGKVTEGDLLELGDPPKSGKYFKVNMKGQEGYIYGANVEAKTTEASNDTTPSIPDVTPITSPPTGTTTTAEVIAVPEPYDGCSKVGDADSHPAADGDLNKLKNRDYKDILGKFGTMTFASVIDLPNPNVTKGQKRATWASDDLQMVQPYEKEAVSVEGYILLAREEGPESCNCHLTGHQDHDFHVWLSAEPGDGSNAPDRTHAVVVEISPRIRSVHQNWTVAKLLNYAKQGTPVRIIGLLLYDDEHPEQVGKTRGTLWEIHPIMKIEYKQGNNWVELN